MIRWRLLAESPRGTQSVVGEFELEGAARAAAPSLMADFGVNELELQRLEDGLHGLEWYKVDTLTPPHNYHQDITTGLHRLRRADPEAYQQLVSPGAGFSAIPAYAQDDGPNGEWWVSEDARAVCESITGALEECAERADD